MRRGFCGSREFIKLLATLLTASNASWHNERVISRLFPLLLLLEGCDRSTDVDPAGTTLIRSALPSIQAFHREEAKSGALLRVVYFHPADREPLPGYAERLDRAMADVSAFYRDGLRRFGYKSDGIPYEKKNGRLHLHVVRGKKPASGYSYASGDEIEREIQTALGFSRKYVLAIHALCHREADGRYVFNAPYYGYARRGQGFCHAADCELLDPALLSDPSPMVITEHYNPRWKMTVGEFNSKYLGGIAHELGHALGLYHEKGCIDEPASNVSLMSDGNLHYREHLNGGKRTSYLSRTAALSLLSHPLLTGTDRERWSDPQAEFVDLKLEADGPVLRVRGQVKADIPAYAVVAYAWTMQGDEHFARPYPVVLLEEGRFEIQLSDLMKTHAFALRLVSFHVNGARHVINRDFGHDASGRPTAPWVVREAERAILQQQPDARSLLTDEAIARASKGDQRLLRILREVLDPPPLIDLANTDQRNAYLSDAKWESASVGWGQPARNHYWFDDQIRNQVFLQIGGHIHSKGLYAHSTSRYVFDLAARWKQFEVKIGLHDKAQTHGSAVFRVLGDGRELYRSRVLHANSHEKPVINVTGVRTLELLCEGAEGHNHNSWAIWADPELNR
jgi:NPCBM/NEW2 domain